MPSVITHYLLAEKVKEQLQVRLYDEAFYCGAQGPDMLLLHRKLPWLLGANLNQAGSELHKADPAETFGFLSEYFRKNNNDIIKSYIIGFVCHYALDCAVHPYIYAMEELYAKTAEEQTPGMTQTSIHHQIETMLDVIALRGVTGKEPTKFRLTKAFTSDSQVRSAVVRLYEFILTKQLSIQNHRLPRMIDQSYKDTRRVFSVLNNTWLMKRWIVTGAEKLFKIPKRYSSLMRPILEDDDFDYSNEAGRPWQNPFTGEESTQGFLQLFDEAVQRAVILVNAFLSQTLVQEAGHLSFSGQPAEGEKAGSLV